MVQHWQNMLQALYAITATLEPLDGEHDLNFAVTADDGSQYIL